MVGLIKNLKIKVNLQVQFLCCDNTGENVAFERVYKQEGLEVDFEYTAPGMPQQSGQIEQNFATLFNQVYAMLNSGEFNAYLQNGLWAEAANTAMLLKNNPDNSQQKPKPLSTIFCKGKEKHPVFDAKIW